MTSLPTDFKRVSAIHHPLWVFLRRGLLLLKSPPSIPMVDKKISTSYLLVILGQYKRELVKYHCIVLYGGEGDIYIYI